MVKRKLSVCPLPSEILMQALLQHVDQCMQHEDVVKKIMLAQLARTLIEWHCHLFTDLIDEMELWEERVDETRIITTEGLTTCLDP